MCITLKDTLCTSQKHDLLLLQRPVNAAEGNNWCWLWW